MYIYVFHSFLHQIPKLFTNVFLLIHHPCSLGNWYFSSHNQISYCEAVYSYFDIVCQLVKIWMACEVDNFEMLDTKSLTARYVLIGMLPEARPRLCLQLLKLYSRVNSSPCC